MLGFSKVKSKNFPVVFKSAVKNKRKIKENGNLGFWCNSKINDRRYMTF